MHEAELRQARVTNQNSRAFGIGVVGLIVIALVLYSLTQYTVRSRGDYPYQQFPVSGEQVRSGPPPIAAPDQVPGESPGQLGGGAYQFVIPAPNDLSTIYFT